MPKNKRKATTPVPGYRLILAELAAVTAVEFPRNPSTMHFAARAAFLVRNLEIAPEYKDDVIEAWQLMMSRVGEIRNCKLLNRTERSDFHGARDVLGLNYRDRPKQVHNNRKKQAGASAVDETVARAVAGPHTLEGGAAGFPETALATDESQAPVHKDQPGDNTAGGHLATQHGAVNADRMPDPIAQT